MLCELMNPWTSHYCRLNKKRKDWRRVESYWLGLLMFRLKLILDGKVEKNYFGAMVRVAFIFFKVLLLLWL